MKNLTTWLLIIVVILLAVVPLFLAQGSEFGGADGEAETAITEIQPDYQPWFSPLFEPPSGETKAYYSPFKQPWERVSLPISLATKLGKRKLKAQL